MLEVMGLKKTFIKNEQYINDKGKKKNKQVEFNAVDGISFSASDGEILGILGPNGAGKTTLLRMIGGILTPDDGKVIFDSEDSAKDLNRFKKNIGYLSGNTKLYKKLTPREIMSTFASLNGMTKEEISKSIENIVDLMKMGDFIDNRIENLSTGQTQRASIARCLIHSPKLYIFDEPTLGLDVISSKGIIDFMKNEKASGKIVLYSTHYMEEAESLCDKIVFLYKGKIIASGSPKQIMEESSTDNLRDAFIKLADIGGENEI